MDMFSKRVALLLTLCCLCGCSTGAQRELARMQTVQADSAAAYNQCADPVFQNPEYSGITKKTHLSTNDPNFPLEMLNDTTLPSKEQTKNIYAIYGDIQPCRQIILDAASKTSPLLVLTWVQTFSKIDQLWADFAKGKMTWGKFNTDRKAIYEDNKVRLVQASMQINGQLQSQHQSEIEQRQRAAEAFSQWAAQQQAFALQQQAINAANRPRVINCNYFGNTATCNSN
jgi:hypothetical protein